MNLAVIVGTKELMMSTGYVLLKSKLPLLSISNACLPVFAGKFSVSVSWLHLIIPPLRLLGLVIVIGALMKEPLLKVTCATSEESSIRFNLTVLLFKKKILLC